MGRDGAQTSRRVLDAVGRIVAERGLEGIRIREIAAEAGLSPGSVLYHYPDHSQLLYAVHVDTVRRYLDGRAAAAGHAGVDSGADVRAGAGVEARAGVGVEARAGAGVEAGAGVGVEAGGETGAAGAEVAAGAGGEAGIDAAQRLMAMLRAGVPPWANEHVIRLLYGLHDLARRSQEHADLLTELWRDELALYVELIRAGVAEGIFTPAGPLNEVAAGLLALEDGLALHRISNNTELSSDRAITTFAGIAAVLLNCPRILKYAAA